MLTLGPDDILLDRHADNWQAALDSAANALAEAGLVAAEYRDGLHAREAQSSTYLGNAIAIPHGTPESRHHVKRTGVRVLQFPKGVQWHDGHTVHVLVTIAAQNDEHLDILRQLTHALDRDGVATELARASSAARIAAICKCCSGPIDVPIHVSLLTVIKSAGSCAVPRTSSASVIS